jgi:DNA-binding NtrC family response regulator
VIVKNAARILIVDDDSAVRKLLCFAFVRAGYFVKSASDGSEALALCESESFDVVLSDVVMPGMNGRQLVRSLVQRHPQMRIILMSGFDASEVQEEWPTQCPVLHKPFAPRDAVTVANELLQPVVSTVSAG